MRSKLLIGGIAAVAAFLLATNSLVAQAAAFISSADIINNTIKSKDVKNNALKGKDVKDGSLKGVDVADGSLTSADLAAGTIPTQIIAVKRLPSTNITTPNATKKFAADPAVVTVDADDLIVVNGVLEIDPNAAGDVIDLSTCYRPVGSAAEPTTLDPQDLFDLQAPVATETAYPMVGSGALAAGTYQVGVCHDVFTGTHSVQTVAGTVTVFNGAAIGAFGKPGTSQSEARD
jgi:hypothetical protein